MLASDWLPWSKRHGGQSATTDRSLLRCHQAACTTCEAGYYCTGGGTNTSGRCSPGYYCPAASSSPTEVPCPAGTYQPLVGAEAEEQCAVCPTGEESRPAAAIPVEGPCLQL